MSIDNFVVETHVVVQRVDGYRFVVCSFNDTGSGLVVLLGQVTYFLCVIRSLFIVGGCISLTKGYDVFISSHI